MKNWFAPKSCFTFLGILLFALTGRAQIVAWNTNSLSGTTSTSLNATTNDANLNTAVLSRGNVTAASLNNAYSSSNWVDANITDAIANNRYYQCTISPNNGFKVSLSTLAAKLRRTSTGPNAYIWRYSIDGSNFFDIGTSTSFTTTTSGGDVQPTITLSTITNLQNIGNATIYLRLYAWGASGSGGTLAFGTGNVNSLAFTGSVSSISTPTTTSISPNSATIGDAAFILTVNGTNFINSSIVKFNGVNKTTTFISATQLTAAISQNDLSQAGTVPVNVTTTGAPAVSNNQSFIINSPLVPSFTQPVPLPDFGKVCLNTTAGPNTFTITGSSLDGSNINIGALNGFSYSETSNGTYSNTLGFSYSGNSFNKTIYVKFNPTLIQAYDGNITLSGGGVSTSYNIPATGSGVNTSVTVSTRGATSIKSTTAIANGAITVNGCNPVTAYGIEYSGTSGFLAGTGTQIPSSNLNSGNFSATITGLTPNVRYYYYAYAISNGITTYDTLVGFNAGPLPVLMSAQQDFTFTENFSDIATWGNFFISTTANSGANHFDGLSATATAGPGLGIPNPTVLTTSTNSFQGGSPSALAAGGVQRGSEQTPPSSSIVLLTTNTSDNQTSAAIDFYMDFTGVNAGTLSFNYQTLNNAAGNRASSLRIYATIDGITYTEITDADVLNFANNAGVSGAKTNIQLPAIFNSSSTARLRFYYHNGTGGTTGSRPKIAISNLIVTAVANTPCNSPTAPATNLIFGTVTDASVAGSFTAANPATDTYLIVATTNGSLTSPPVDGHNYNLGDNVGDGTVVAKGSSTSFTATGLSASTQYTFYVFPMNSICTSGPLYYNGADNLLGQASTVAGLPNCAAPTSAPTTYTPGTIGINTVSGSFGAIMADEYLVLVSTSPTFTGMPTNGQSYSTGDVIGNAKVVQKSNATSFTASGLNPDTEYYFYIFSVNTQACVNGPAYNMAPFKSPLQKTNPLPQCSAPSAQPTQLTFNISNTAISGAFTPAVGADDYLVVISTNSTLNTIPVNNTDYNVGDNFGNGTIIANSTSTSFVATGLATATQYYFYTFSANKNCSGGTKYRNANPLSNNTTTTNIAINNYYFGNLHAHSDYSDGNKDNPGYTPLDDYGYAKNSQCMDFLGISEHNHFSSVNNPGTTVANYHLGVGQATNYTNANPGFLALYGMEYGVISNGGHVVIYGDGMDKLFGWERGSGVWGTSNNYDVFVPEYAYIDSNGLFKNINDNVATNTFATLAHPNFTDYNHLADTASYNAIADSAITGAAVESGPATSTNKTYSDPGASLSYLPYFQTLLAKGYHLGPTIDHDNHNTTFGRTTYSRTAVVAPALTKTEIIKGMRNMHFYATQDCDSKVDFSINTKQMGSLITDRYAPNISVTLTDATTATSSAIIRIMYGIPGSGILAEKIDSVIGNRLIFADNNLANLATGYYYADITNGTARIITSPIWYTRNDATSTVVLPITLGSFLAQKINADVKLTWTTEQEANSSHFVIERSVDGNSWSSIGTQTAAGNSSTAINYVFSDNNPLNGINYYRLKQVDIDGKFTYSTTRSVLFTIKIQLSVSPNPARNFINLYVSNTTNEIYHILLTDNNGKLMQKIDSSAQHLLINTSNFAKGVYFLKYVDNNMVTTKKIIIEQ